LEIEQMVQQETDILKTNRPATGSVQDNGYVVGVDMGGTNLRLALSDLTGRIVAKWSSTTVGIQDVRQAITLISNGVEGMLQQSSVSRDLLRAIASGVPGITDVDAGVVIATSYLMGWRNVPFRALLEEAFEIPATIDNDVNIAAVGESWAGAAVGVPDFVFIAIGTGVGAGIILNGQPFHGMKWTAGEIGYMLVPGVSDVPIERGKPGVLEHAIGGEGIREQWRHLWNEEKLALPRELSATEIFDYALKGDQSARRILDRSAKLLGSVIYNIALVLNCPLFVLGGSVGMHPLLCEATRNILEKQNSRVLPELKVSTLGTDAQLIGAVRLALNTAAVKSKLSTSSAVVRQSV
jgi:glucokinase